MDATRVLVAEDDPDNALLLRRLLERRGCRVTVVTRGEEALHAATAAPWDLLLTDVQMPGLDGLELTRRLRAQEGARGAPRLPVVAVTAHPLDDVRREAREAGVDGFLEKPIALAALDAVLRAFARGGLAPAEPVAPASAADAAVDAVDADGLVAGLARRARLDLAAADAVPDGAERLARLEALAHRLERTGRGFGLTDLCALADALGQAAARAEGPRLAETLRALDRLLAALAAAP